MRSSISALAPAVLLLLQPVLAHNLERRGGSDDCDCPTATVTVAPPCVTVVTSVITVTQTATLTGGPVTVTVTETTTTTPFSSLGPVSAQSSSTETNSNPGSVISPMSSLLPGHHTHTKTKTHTKGSQPTETQSGSPSETGTNTESQATKTKTKTHTKSHQGGTETSSLLPASETSLPTCPGTTSIAYVTITDTIIQTVTGWAPSATPFDKRYNYNKVWGSW